MIRLDADNDAPTPAESAARLAAAVDSRPGLAADSYGDGAVVREAEAMVARLLGKERAVLFATGTLANLLALDRLCPRRARRVLVHPESHFAEDTGDSAALAGLTLVRVAASGPGFTAEAALAAIAASRAGRVRQEVGAILVETPVRRRANQMFPLAELDRVVAAAKAEKIALHLDGARLPIAAASAGRSCAAFAAPFDAVYLSLWKMLGLPWGAALAGPAALLEGIEHDRRRFGGALPQLWPLAAMVLAHLEERLAVWPAVLARAAEVRAALAADGRFVVVAMDGDATNSFWLEAPGVEPAALREAARAAGLALPEPKAARFPLRANPTWLTLAPAALAARLAAAAVTTSRA